jgi:hypothetical protein
MGGDANSMVLKAVDLLVNIAHSGKILCRLPLKSSLPDYTSAAHLLVSGNPAQTNDV